MDDELREVLRSFESGLQSIDSRLRVIESRLTPQQAYPVEDVAQMTGYAVWTLRQACNQGRIPGAYKASDRSWRIPHASLEGIQGHGLPKQVA